MEPTLDTLLTITSEVVADLRVSHPNSIRNRAKLEEALVAILDWHAETREPSNPYPVNSFKHG